jgi:hypothetical protein
VTRFYQPLRTVRDRALALRAVERAPDGYTVEVREAKRSDDQNSALWSLLGQIHKQRPTHNGVKMTPELWKSVFMDALGAEMVLMPKLDGDGFFPLGHRSSQLGVSEFSQLLELILAWTAREGLEIRHFDFTSENRGEASVSPRGRAA